MTPPFSVDVVTNQAMIPAKKPVMDPHIQPHLFALLQVTPRAMGTTADPRMTPMKVYSIKVSASSKLLRNELHITNPWKRQCRKILDLQGRK
jgi:hypothetical protein